MIAVLIGACVGAGVLLVWSAFGTRQRLAAALAPNRDASFEFDDLRANALKSRLTGLLDRPWLRDLIGPDMTADLAVGANTPAAFTFDTAIKVVGCWAAIALARVLDPGFYLFAGTNGLFAAIAIAVLVVAASLSDVRSKARRRRREMLEAVASYVEFTRLAAQTRPIEGAMNAAVRCGATWPFQVIANVFASAERRNEAPWAGLAELGRTFEIPDLLELAGALEVAATEGTRVQDTLSAKSQSLRRRLTAAEIREAESRTEQLNVPLTGLGICVFVLVIAPALLAF